jgi:hypothetical protein
MREGLSTPQGLRWSIPGGVEMREKKDDGGRGRERNDLLGPRVCALVACQAVRENGWHRVIVHHQGE